MDMVKQEDKKSCKEAYLYQTESTGGGRCGWLNQDKNLQKHQMITTILMISGSFYREEEYSIPERDKEIPLKKRTGYRFS